MWLPIQRNLKVTSSTFVYVNLIYWLTGEFYKLGKYFIVRD